MSGQDWDSVVFTRKPATGKAAKAAANQARASGGTVVSEKKFAAGSNSNHAGPSNARRLEEETESFRHEHVSKEFGIRLQQARAAKKWTQKDLATHINEKPAVVNDYESGAAIPNQAIIAKMEKALGVRLRGKE